MSVAAYKRTISHTEAPRQIERRILAQVTSELEQQFDAFDNAERKIDRLQVLADGLRHSLWRNQQVWATFKMDLMEKENNLSPELRASLVSLAIWVEGHTQSVMAGGKNVKPLIDINRSIIDGLGGRAFDTAAE
ncbi:flagellar biosynthesis regulator FlaF [Sulfitobacter mediterraneus]|jgi:flagellar biosynthesis activator protein FlaF|uniref:flagellar biosynthesis regulator FlaF n=1 Tax=Sulfitobacter TaxID=60136 RepID=UPI001933D0CC|nr:MULTISPECIES: flagellar biosynthesis regulator FlaF [Sulfitobacter]MBM1635013.1 flagellar biosynthesis regulator FlaF [Sulfitobacter mediterraneus]MBM1642882.1 flagellar biosynthesis regulator FlaF [Sulfitobacter mediterraneus]MBM1646911.1 flagellar biosynthesis regulator FlaF [Sulfitobacter mediterraneus]MBM1650916.1 flagellar biosynthesis regulator FlaF [Sulfitobacter mediterraneus]MBM1655021.1 flagellar biosynthesis regulator FlaF [Sulfitobacter mediterraneus]